MTNRIGMATQLAGQSLRFGWYFTLNRLLDWRSAQLGKGARPRPGGPAPSLSELLASQAELLLSDALAVRDGLYPAMEDDATPPLRHLARIGRMFADLPEALSRRAANDATSVQAEPGAAELPAYYAQDFHFQTGGYLSEGSATLYDVQVETLFMGAAGPMRRAALAPLAEALSGRDQRRLTLLDVACGTGRFLRQVRLAYPALRLKGLDLSRAYLQEARHHLGELRPIEWIEAAAERMPLAAASVDVVTCIFLFHELPPEVRRAATAEIARVLRPGGVFIFLDSLQLGDKPAWDGLLQSFPYRFHEPYYQGYLSDGLEGVFEAHGLEAVLTSTPFLSKLMVRRKALASAH
ncbi:MAG TPA: class I SAM-dependent methyltransferase [Hyphomicrobiaceae bacterium]|nr:class I SAM-dependent methyltransferase [Hyphomicrobiaceae bacterium]